MSERMRMSWGEIRAEETNVPHPLVDPCLMVLL